MENEKRAQPVIRGIHISRMNAAIIVASLVLYIILTATAVHVSHTVQDVYQSVDSLYSYTLLKDFLEDSCDYLTEQSRLYVVTGEQSYMDQYFFALHDAQSREFTVWALEQFDQDGKAEEYLQSALERSNTLVEQELHAMALVYLAQGHDPSGLPQNLQQVELTPEEQSMQPEELRARGSGIVFGTEYQKIRGEINDDMDYALDALDNAMELRMQESHQFLRRALLTHQILIGVHFAATLIGFAFSILLVVLPMWNYVKCIKDRKQMRLKGAYECKCLAYTCNVMFERNAAQELRLRHQAEHDALTGLLNRGAFDALEQELSGQSDPMGLLLIDVDKFKQVNDGYGHEMGDRVLKTVADLLAENFRITDFPARIGGDEFAVILTNAEEDRKEGLRTKIEAINHTLTHPTDGRPVVSLSVGGAFSPKGFTGDLYKHADLALYEVKEHGRCGCRFYEGETAGV